MIRIQLEEYGDSISLEFISNQIGIKSTELQRLFQLANSKIKKALHLNIDPIVCEYDKVYARNIAGTIRLSNQLELEIIPKYLKHYSESKSWKEDFYLLSTISKYGKLLSNEGIRSSTSMKSSLYDLAGRTLAEQYNKLHRHPLRKYRKCEFREYSIEGDVIFDNVFELHPDGTMQEKINFDDRNIYNATILQAMKAVRQYVTDSKTLTILERAIAKLSPQNTISILGRRLYVPNRDKKWEHTYNLSYDILLGMGSIFDTGKVLSPGFVSSTWQVWEWLITIATKIGAKECRVIGQEPLYFGEITKPGDLTKTTTINVHPDVVVYGDEYATPKYLIDAKYKYINPKESISRTDIYEGYSFCKASGASIIFMIYPEENNASGSIGRLEFVQESIIEDKKIVVCKASMASIAQSGGLVKFSNNMVDSINSYLS